MLGAYAVVLLVSVTAGLAGVGSAVAARHRAQSAADLAALAGAGELAAGPQRACARSARLAAAMGTTLIDCTAEDLDVTVVVQAEPALAGWLLGPARAAARAGPVQGRAARRLRCRERREGLGVVSPGGNPAASISASVAGRTVARSANVPASSSTRLSVMCTGTQP